MMLGNTNNDSLLWWLEMKWGGWFCYSGFINYLDKN